MSVVYFDLRPRVFLMKTFVLGLKEFVIQDFGLTALSHENLFDLVSLFPYLVCPWEKVSVSPLFPFTH